MRYADLTDKDRLALEFYAGKGRTRKNRPGTDDCVFCGHSYTLHTGNEGSGIGCAAPECGDPEEKRGRCFVYQSELEADQNDEWERKEQQPVLVSPQQVANRLHERRYGKGEDHFPIHSCPCMHEAMYYLGVEVKLKVHWPDGKGGNAWDPHGIDDTVDEQC